MERLWIDGQKSLDSSVWISQGLASQGQAHIGVVVVIAFREAVQQLLRPLCCRLVFAAPVVQFAQLHQGALHIALVAPFLDNGCKSALSLVESLLPALRLVRQGAVETGVQAIGRARIAQHGIVLGDGPVEQVAGTGPVVLAQPRLGHLLVRAANAIAHPSERKTRAAGNIAIAPEIDAVFLDRLLVLAAGEQALGQGVLNARPQGAIGRLVNGLAVRLQGRRQIALLLVEISHAQIGLFDQTALRAKEGDHPPIGRHPLVVPPQLGETIAHADLGLGRQLQRGFIDQTGQFLPPHLIELLFGEFFDALAFD